jgi:hypothetical protein
MAPGKHLSRIALSIVAVAVVSMPALAWGPNGHAIVADIAARHLSPGASQQVKALLALEEETTLDEVASWADGYRPSHRETGSWHFVDIPLTAPAFDDSRDCGGGNCVVDRIVSFSHVLADKTETPAKRLQALKFIVHFVADVHQPLHCEDNGDRGGNDVHVSFYGASTNLHSVWDDGLLEHATGLRTLMPGYRIDRKAAQAVADRLNADISGDETTRWASSGMVSDLEGSVAGWANESHHFAQDAYSARGESTELADSYEDREWPVVKGQLERAGTRLAELLNEVLQ